MAPDWRLEGVYEQAQTGRYMLRAKVPAGILSAPQVEEVCAISDRFADGVLHLTTRMSVEFHHLAEADLPEVMRRLHAVGLTSRGACGGAVRGVAVSTPLAAEAPRARGLARRIQEHFTGNPHFEGLPKKFKVGVDACYGGARTLIQDVGLVYAGAAGSEDGYDVWLAGGLGRTPCAGFLYRERAPESRVIPLIEAALRVHRTHTPPGKRLKHVVLDLGRERFTELLEAELARCPRLPVPRPVVWNAAGRPGEAPPRYLVVRIFAGQVDTRTFGELAKLARHHADAVLVLLPSQDVALPVADEKARNSVRRGLARLGLAGDGLEHQVAMGVCPGSHECRMGLAATRDVARALLGAMGPRAAGLTWAVSGCANSCSQPQLADAGVLCSRLAKRADGTREPLFDLYRRKDSGLGRAVLTRVNLETLRGAVRDLD